MLLTEGPESITTRVDKGTYTLIQEPGPYESPDSRVTGLPSYDLRVKFATAVRLLNPYLPRKYQLSVVNK